MKWAFVIKQKIKIAMLLAGIMLSIISIDVIERKNIQDMNNSVSSIYDDRLVPATDIFYITEKLYKKHILMESFFNEPSGNIKKLKGELTNYDQEVSHLISKYEKTFLVDQESKSLKEVKSKIADYKVFEAKVIETALTDTKVAGRKLFTKEGKATLEKATKPLSDLTAIQMAVGSELIKNSKGTLAISELLSTLQMALAILIGIIVMILISASDMMNIRKENFNWN